ncbi:RNA-binding protein 28 [Hoplias malabaricus]|uniref:RNA-binding protein 28 n=1 Tax=Hoplias malabaricus TaxID=27720 RepID=UPI003461B7E5
MSAANLFVSNLPASASSDQLEQLFSEVGPVKRCFVVKDKDSDKCRGFGFVTFSMSEDAQRALNEIKEYGGQKIRVTLAKKKINKKQQEKGKKDQQEKESTDKEPEKKSPQNADGKKMNKKARLIIRNLSFKCSDSDLKELFSKFGTVLDVKIPLKPDGKKRGFAFVQFKNMLEAGKALAEMNLKEIKDRQVAVDWAVAKDLFVSTQSGSASGNKTNKSRNIKDTEVDEHSEDEDKPPVKKSKVQQKEDEHSELTSDDDDDDVDKDVEEDEDEEEEEYQHKGSIGEEIDSDDEQEDTDGSDDDVDEDDDDDDEDDDDDDIAKQKKKKTKKLLPTDVNEGRTVFIRNLSFDSEEEGIEEVLLQFGELNYVRVVLHPETGHSKGCAFAQFKFKEGAEKCLAAAQNDSEAGGVRVDGRKLNIVLAVTREDAAKLATKKVKTHKGSRNLYLAREGLIRAGTKAAEGVSESDMAKRSRFEDLKRAKLKDVNVFVSRTRLCIHNLPRTVDRQRLIQLCLSAAGGGKKARITECHVMYDRKPVRGEVTGRSLGYGFVEFKEHEHALQALRNLNNNPTIFSPNKRPIVEFSLEDSRKLKLKAKRLEKSKAKLAAISKPEKNQSHTDGEQDGKSKHSPCKTPGKGKAAGQSLDLAKTEKKGFQSSHYSGFRTTPEVEHVELEDGKKRQKVLPMPSHRGPKIRQREKGMNKQLVQSKKVKTGPSRKDRKGPFSLEKPNQTKKQSPKPAKKKFRNQDSDRFDSLVEQYKKKLMGASNSKDSLVKKGKWFS